MTSVGRADGMTRTTAGVLRALGDPVRWEMVTRIAAAGELNGVALDRGLDLSKSTVSHHLRILASAGVITTRRSGRTQIYRLNDAVLRGAARSLQDLTSDTDAGPPPPGTGQAEGRYDYAGGDDTLPTW